MLADVTSPWQERKLRALCEQLNVDFQQAVEGFRDFVDSTGTGATPKCATVPSDSNQHNSCDLCRHRARFQQYERYMFSSSKQSNNSSFVTLDVPRRARASCCTPYLRYVRGLPRVTAMLLTINQGNAN